MKVANIRQTGIVCEDKDPDPTSLATVLSKTRQSSNHLSLPVKGSEAEPGSKVASSHIDPARRSDVDDVTAELALSQTVAARTLLYFPGHCLVQELGEVAAVLRELIRDLGSEDQNTVSKRLFADGGLLGGKKIEVLFDSLTRVGNEQMAPYTSEAATGLDRAVVIALMGDIGELYAGTAVKGSEREVQEQADALKSFNDLMRGRGLAALSDEAIHGIHSRDGFYKPGPLKKVERSRPFEKLSHLNGIHNFGEAADRRIGIAQEEKIPGVGWKIAHISVDRIRDSIEPLAGHMSGSPVEILQVWDMLRGDAHELQFFDMISKGNLQGDISMERKDQKLARASGAAAFLIGLGYHSAVEVSETILLYMGQTLRVILDKPEHDAAQVFGHGAATSLICELLEKQARTH